MSKVVWNFSVLKQNNIKFKDFYKMTVKWLLMLNTLKTTRLLNVFHTENYTKTWNVKWCPFTSMWVEIQHHSRSEAGDFTWASCGTDSKAVAEWNQALNQHPLCAEPPPGGQWRAQGCTALPGGRDTPFVLPGTESQATPEKPSQTFNIRALFQ